MKLSIVTTLYKSGPYIEEFCKRASESARKLVSEDYEIVLVNDGCPDNSLDMAVTLHEKDSHVVLVDLSRNFGHHKAMMTGLIHARGELVYLLDSDLEEEPEWLIPFHAQMQREDCDVVYGVQERRKGRWFERCSGDLFYKIFGLLTGLKFPKSPVNTRLMSRRYVDSLLKHSEREVFMLGLWCITGFLQLSQVVKKHNKHRTTYTLRRKMALFVNSITSFSNAPLIFIFYVGIFILSISSSSIIYLLMKWFFFIKPPSGWTSVIASIWFLGGLIISFIGVIGIYLSKIFIETKQRPYTIVRDVYRKAGTRDERHQN